MSNYYGQSSRRRGPIPFRATRRRGRQRLPKTHKAAEQQPIPYKAAQIGTAESSELDFKPAAASNRWSLSFSEALSKATDLVSSIEVNPRIQGGSPVVRGTRIPVHSILRAVENYMTLDGAIRCYPDLTIGQVKDAVYFARVILESPVGINEATVAP